MAYTEQEKTLFALRFHEEYARLLSSYEEFPSSTISSYEKFPSSTIGATPPSSEDARKFFAGEAMSVAHNYVLQVREGALTAAAVAGASAPGNLTELLEEAFTI